MGLFDFFRQAGESVRIGVTTPPPQTQAARVYQPPPTSQTRTIITPPKQEYQEPTISKISKRIQEKGKKFAKKYPKPAKSIYEVFFKTGKELHKLPEKGQEIKTQIEKAEQKVSSKIPEWRLPQTVSGFEQKGREFARQYPQEAKRISQITQKGTKIVRKVIPKSIGERMGATTYGAGRGGYSFVKGAYSEVKEKPIQTGGLILAGGVYGRGVKAVSRVAPKLARPILTTKAGKTVIPSAIGTGELATAGYFGYQAKKSAEEPDEFGGKPSFEVQAERYGRMGSQALAFGSARPLKKGFVRLSKQQVITPKGIKRFIKSEEARVGVIGQRKRISTQRRIPKDDRPPSSRAKLTKFERTAKIEFRKIERKPVKRDTTAGYRALKEKWGKRQASFKQIESKGGGQSTQTGLVVLTKQVVRPISEQAVKTKTKSLRLRGKQKTSRIYKSKGKHKSQEQLTIQQQLNLIRQKQQQGLKLSVAEKQLIEKQDVISIEKLITDSKVKGRLKTDEMLITDSKVKGRLKTGYKSKLLTTNVMDNLQKTIDAQLEKTGLKDKLITKGKQRTKEKEKQRTKEKEKLINIPRQATALTPLEIFKPRQITRQRPKTTTTPGMGFYTPPEIPKIFIKPKTKKYQLFKESKIKSRYGKFVEIARVAMPEQIRKGLRK